MPINLFNLFNLFDLFDLFVTDPLSLIRFFQETLG